MPRPPQVIREFRIGPQRTYGIQFFGQGGLGKHGVELPVAGGTELDLRTESSASGSGDKVMRGEVYGLSLAEFADRSFNCGARRRDLRRSMALQDVRSSPALPGSASLEGRPANRRPPRA